MDYKIRKVKSVVELGNSPRQTEPATPVRSIRIQDRMTSASPSLKSTTYTIKRPPSAAKVLDMSRRAASALEQRPSSANAMTSMNVIRPASSLSNRSMQTSKAADTIVSVRVKPNDTAASQSAWMVDSQMKSISAIDTSGAAYSYDNVFCDIDANTTVYSQCAKKLVESVIEGFHGTVFAYGMTGTGKTFSMQGTPGSPGIITQAVQDIFRLIDGDHNNKFNLKVSYLEIYNERIRDLLADASSATEEIRIREDARRGAYAFPVIEMPVSSTTAFLDIIQKGDQSRHSAATDYNAHSSRSHTMIQVIVEAHPASSHESKSPTQTRISTLNLIDLAGSERASSDAERRKEGAYINKSLLTLGTVISRLTSSAVPGSVAHIPFRDSKLTRLLQYALSGQSLISILATVNVDGRFANETGNTLKFASRAKFIPGKAKKAELFTGDVGQLIESLKSEISALRSQLHAQNGHAVPVDDRTLRLRDVNIGLTSLTDINEDDSQVVVLQTIINKLLQEKEEANLHIRSLQAQLLRYQQPDAMSSGQSRSPRSPAGNFSYPIGHLSRAHSETSPVYTNGTKLPSNDEDDRGRAAADRQLAASMLDKSLRSREQARDLSNQIAHLKRREDKKSLASRLGITGLGRSTHDLEDVQHDLSPTSPNSFTKPSHTLISPSIRAPREAGFF